MVSAVSFWEVAMLIAKGRLRSIKSALDLRDIVLNAGINEIPLTGNIAVLAGTLDGLHGDPADRFIVATAITFDATLMTADATLLHWSHKLKRQNAEK
jgi:PIN domain nuclease of toxin-antitoxin system